MKIMKSYGILGILCIMYCVLGNVTYCRQLPRRGALEDDEWRAAAEDDKWRAAAEDDEWRAAAEDDEWRAAAEDDEWRAAAEDDEWRAATDELSADKILNNDFRPQVKDDGRTIDEIISDAGTEKAAGIEAAKHGEMTAGMDEIVDPEEFAEEFGKEGEGSARMAGGYDWRLKNERLAAVGVWDLKKRWPNGIIPYKIDPEYSENQREIIYTAMQMWMRKTCIRFVVAGSAEAKSTGHSHFINIKSGVGCFSRIGYVKRSSEVILNKDDCMWPFVVAHELGHAIGLHHAQMRSDQDEHVQILYENILPNKWSQFRHTWAFFDFAKEYDYCSVMHYGPTLFSRGKFFTMIPKDLGYLAVIGIPGQNLSFTDATVVNNMYECNIIASPTVCLPRPCTDIYPAEWCRKVEEDYGKLPGFRGLSEFKGNGDARICKDATHMCGKYKTYGYCSKEYGRVLCPKSCGNCTQ